MLIRALLRSSSSSAHPFPRAVHSTPEPHLTQLPEAAAAADETKEEDETLISTVVSILIHQRSRTRWRSLRPFLPSLTPSHISLVTFHLRNKPHLALSFSRALPRASQSLHTLSSLALVLARNRLRPAALSALRSALILSPDHHLLFRSLLLSFGRFSSAPFVFDLLVRSLLLSRRVDHALEIVSLLKSRNISPEIATCNEIIRAVIRARGADAGLAAYAELFEKVAPRISTFNVLLGCMYREGNLSEKAGEVRKEMEKFGCEPNTYTYCVLMAGLGEEGKVEEAVELWEEMGRKEVRRDIVAYNTFVDVLCRGGDVARAEEVFREMVMEGITPTGVTYEHLIDGHCAAGDVEAALILYGDIKRKGYGMRVATVEVLVESLCGREMMVDGLKIMRNEMKKVEFFPSRRCYKVLIKGFCEMGDMEAALKLQMEMVGKGFDPDIEVYDAFVRGYEKRGEVEKVERLRMEMSGIGCTSNS